MRNISDNYFKLIIIKKEMSEIKQIDNLQEIGILLFNLTNNSELEK